MPERIKRKHNDSAFFLSLQCRKNAPQVLKENKYGRDVLYVNLYMHMFSLWLIYKRILLCSKTNIRQIQIEEKKNVKWAMKLSKWNSSTKKISVRVYVLVMKSRLEANPVSIYRQDNRDKAWSNKCNTSKQKKSIIKETKEVTFVIPQNR